MIGFARGIRQRRPPRHDGQRQWISRLLKLGATIGALVSVMAVVEPTFASDPPTWGKPTQISPELPTSWFPDLYADPTGAVRVVWTSNLSWDPNSESNHLATGAVMFNQLQDGAWGTSRDIRVMDAGIASRPMIASDGTYVHMLYRTGTEGTTTLNYMRALATSDLGNAHSWTDETNISTGAYYAQLMVLPDQSIVVLYNEPFQVSAEILAQSATPVNRLNLLLDATDGPPDVRPVLMSRRSTDHGLTWSNPLRISTIGNRVGRISLAMSPDGSDLIATWDQGYDNNTGLGDPSTVATADSRDGGATWQHVQTVTSTVGPIEQSVVAANDKVSVLAYRSTVENKIFYRVSTDGGATWSDEGPIPNVIARPYLGKHTFDKLSMAVDGDGRVLLAYVGRSNTDTEDLSVMVVTFGNGVWTEPAVVATPVGFAEYPRIAIGLGNNVQIVFFVRDNEFDTGHYILWSVTGTSDAKPIPPVAVTAPAAVAPAVTTTPASVAPTPSAVAVVPTVPSTHVISHDTRIPTPRVIQRNPIVETSLVSLVAILALLVLANSVRFIRDRLG